VGCGQAKDADSQALYWPTLDLLEEAVRVFQGAPLRMGYLEKLIGAPIAAPHESVHSLITGMADMTWVQSLSLRPAHKAIHCEAVTHFHKVIDAQGHFRHGDPAKPI
jgi:hypothetical protein